MIVSTRCGVSTCIQFPLSVGCCVYPHPSSCALLSISMCTHLTLYLDVRCLYKEMAACIIVARPCLVEHDSVFVASNGVSSTEVVVLGFQHGVCII